MYRARRQILGMSLFAFCGPGIYNTIEYTQKQDEDVSHTVAVTSQITVYALFAITAAFAYPFHARYNPRISIFIGGMAYGINAVLDYVSYKQQSTTLLTVGSILIGLSAGIFWTALLSLVITYSTIHDNGRHIAMVLSLMFLGGITGSLLDLVIYTQGDRVNPLLLHWTMTAIIILGVVFLSTFIVSPIDKVVRNDKTHPVAITHGRRAGSFLADTKEAFRGYKEPFVLKLILYFAYSNCVRYYVVELGYLNSMFFKPESACLNIVLYLFSGIVSVNILKMIMDMKSWSVKKRGRVMISLNGLYFIVSWSLSLVMIYSTANSKVDRLASQYDPAGDTYEAVYTPMNRIRYEVVNQAWVPSEDGDVMGGKLINDLAWFPGHQKDLELGDVVIDGCEWLTTTLAHMRAKVPDIYKEDGVTLDEPAMRLACFQMNDTDSDVFAKCIWDIRQCVEPQSDIYGRINLDFAGHRKEHKICDMYQEELCIQIVGPTDNTLLVVPQIMFVMMGAMDGALNAIPLWLIAIKADNNLCVTMKYVAISKSLQSFGTLCSALLDLFPVVLWRYQTIVNIVVGGIAILLAAFAINDLETPTVYKREDESSDDHGMVIQLNGCHSYEAALGGHTEPPVSSLEDWKSSKSWVNDASLYSSDSYPLILTSDSAPSYTAERPP